MKVIRIATRVYVNKLDLALSFYENLLGKKADMRFTYPEVGLELAAVGDFLLLAGSEEALKPFKDTKVTLLVDSIEEFKSYLEENGAKIVRDIKNVPTGKNMTVEHPDGSIFEYVQHFNREDS